MILQQTELHKNDVKRGTELTQKPMLGGKKLRLLVS